MRASRTITISIVALGLLAGSAVGVAAQDEEADASVTTVTGTTMWLNTVEESTETMTPDGISENVGGVNVFRFEASDPRLTGDATVTSNWVLIEDAESFGSLNADTYELSNDGGSWHGESTGFGSPGFGAGRTIILVGQDGYDGLTAYLHGEFVPDLGGEEFKGLILPTAMPEIPEAPAE